MWDDKRIEKFNKRVNFKNLSYNLNLKISQTTLDIYQDEWNWSGISGHPTLINSLIPDILRHPKVIWQTPSEYDNYDCYSNALKDINLVYSVDRDNSQSYLTSISTNPGIVWSKYMYSTYGMKLDLWLWALFGNAETRIDI